MIRETIDAINSRITAGLATSAVQVAGIAVPVHDQQEGRQTLILPDAAERLYLDSALLWQSAHLTDGSRVTGTQTFGSLTDHQHEVRFILIGLSRSASGKDVAMQALNQTSYVVVDDYTDKTVEVLQRYWQIKTGPEKNYDPTIFAFAIRYHLTGVTDEEFAELPLPADVAKLPITNPQTGPAIQHFIVVEGGELATTLEPVPLTVTQNGQTVWDLGQSEPRRVLYVGGLRYYLGADYTIDLPLLVWHGGFTLKLHHELYLT